MPNVATELATGWPGYAVLVLFCALVGFLAHSIANRLLYAPPTTRFGLLGVVPRRAGTLAEQHATLVADLVGAQELLARVEPARLAEEIGTPLLHIVDELAADVAGRNSPGLWELLPGRLKRVVLEAIRRESPRMVADVVEEVTVDAHDVLDLRHLVRTGLADPAVLGRLTERIAARSLTGARRYGTGAGALVGVVAALALAATGSLLVLPIAGLLAAVGSRWAGTAVVLRDFGRRRARVEAAAYADTLTREVVTFDAVVAELTGAAQVGDTVSREVHRTVDERLTLAKPVVVAVVGARQFQRIKQDAADGVVAVLPEALRPAARYTVEAMDVRNTLAHRVRRLPAHRYDTLLRPVLRAERATSWPCCAVFGAAVGALAMLVPGVLG